MHYHLGALVIILSFHFFVRRFYYAQNEFCIHGNVEWKIFRFFFIVEGVLTLYEKYLYLVGRWPTINCI